LLRYGGHSAAAGLELQSSALAGFAAALDRHAASTFASEDFRPRERVDAIVQGQQLGMELAEELVALAPFGMGNPSVSLMLEDASFRDLRPMGEGKHARFTVQSGGAHAQAVAFGMGTKLGVGEAEPARATFTLEVNEWRGVSEPRLVLRHAQSVDQAANLEPCLTHGPAQSTLFPLPLPLAVAAATS
jgi:single-stranded-DNA-specific exonuclease